VWLTVIKKLEVSQELNVLPTAVLIDLIASMMRYSILLMCRVVTYAVSCYMFVQCTICKKKHWGSPTGEKDEAPPAAPRGVGCMLRGIPLPSRLGGLAERCELPQWGPGRSPDCKRICSIITVTERL